MHFNHHFQDICKKKKEKKRKERKSKQTNKQTWGQFGRTRFSLFIFHDRIQEWQRIGFFHTRIRPVGQDPRPRSDPFTKWIFFSWGSNLPSPIKPYHIWAQSAAQPKKKKTEAPKKKKKKEQIRLQLQNSRPSTSMIQYQKKKKKKKRKEKRS